MAHKIVVTERYTRIATHFLKRHPDMPGAYLKTLALLELNPHHPSLRLHAGRAVEAWELYEALRERGAAT